MRQLSTRPMLATRSAFLVSLTDLLPTGSLDVLLDATQRLKGKDSEWRVV